MTTTSKPTRAQRRETARSNPDRVSFGATVAWSSSHASQAANFLVLSFFTIYCTDTLGLSAPIVGALLLVSKLIDAVGVLFAGYLVDRAPETRWGKARPFDLAIVGIWIFTAVMFATPTSLGEVGRYVWVFVMYLIVSAIFTPLFMSNQPLFLARAFATRNAVTKASSGSGIVIGVLALVVGVSFPIFVQSVGKSPEGWAMLVLWYAIPMTIIGLVRFFFIREKHAVAEPRTRITFRDVRKVLATNPYLWAVAAVQFIVAILGNLGALTYYYRYVVGDVSLQGIFGAFAIVTLPLFLVIPKLIRRFSVSKLIAAAALLGGFGYALYFFAGDNIAILGVAALFTALGATPVAFLLPILIIDNSTYNEWKGNRRLESIGGGVTGFAQQLGMGVGAAVLGVVFGATGYDGTRDVQSAGATFGIVAMNSIVPLALSIVAFIIAVRYHRFEKQLPTITTEIEVRRAAKVVGAPSASGVSTPVPDSAEPPAPTR